MEEGPIRAQDNSAVPGERVIDKPDLNPRGQISTKWAETQTFGMEGQVKIGHDEKFEVLCDEPPRLGGKGEHPQPLTYIAMGVGF
jgi:hypothetical protein